MWTWPVFEAYIQKHNLLAGDSLWRHYRRDHNPDTSLLCPSVILRPGRARTPALFGLRPGPSWNEGLKAAQHAFASLNFSTTVSTEVLKSSEGETGASRRKPLFFFPLSVRFTHRCLSVTIMAAIDLPMAVAACLVAWRAKSVVRRSSATSSGDKPDPYPGLSADQPGTLEALP